MSARASCSARSRGFGLMNAYALFFLGCGAIGIPALILFAVLARRQTPASG